MLHFLAIWVSKTRQITHDILYRNYTPDPKLCIIECLSVYIGIRKTKADSKLCQQRLITYGKPHKGASKDTIARWVKEILKNSGVQKIHQRFQTP